MASIAHISMHGGEDPDAFLGAAAPPIFQNSLFVEPRSGTQRYFYSRASNPTVEIAERKIAALEHGEAARCFSSGMGAISSTILHFTKAGSHVVCARAVYGGTHALLDTLAARMGIITTYVDGNETTAFADAIQENTSLIYLESPGYCTYGILDLAAIAKIARARGIPTVIDNTYSTPIFQNPLDLGIDVVIHSASKYLGGHSDIVAGVVVSNEQTASAIADHERSLLGNHMDPHSASLLIRGIRTLELRMARHQDSAMRIAIWLENQDQVGTVFHPGLPSFAGHDLAYRQMRGFSGLVSFVPADPSFSAQAFVSALHMFRKGPSWGGFESLVMPFEPSVADIAKLGIPAGLIRLSIGLEDPVELIEDLRQALEICSQTPGKEAL